jgi:hypothetical protein
MRADFLAEAIEAKRMAQAFHSIEGIKTKLHKLRTLYSVKVSFRNEGHKKGNPRQIKDERMILVHMWRQKKHKGI